MTDSTRGLGMCLVLSLAVACGSDPASPAGGPTDAAAETGGASATGGSAGSGGASAGSGGSAVGGMAGDAGIAGGGSAGVGGAGGMGGQSGTDAGICGPNVPVYAPTQCTNCIVANCCAQKAACGANPECVALRQCGGQPGCSSGPCWEQCRQTHAAGVADQEIFGSCLDKECNSECIGNASSVCGMSIPGSVACQTCMNSKCCTEIYDATQTADFWNWMTCWQACPSGDTVCQGACASQYPTGLQKSDTVNACWAGSCGTECT